MPLPTSRGAVVISQQVRPFAWSNFDPVTRSKVVTVESGLGTLIPDVITPWGTNSLGPTLAALGASAPASIASSTANRAHYWPFNVTVPCTVYKMFWYNGASVAGNIDCGIFNGATGAKVISTGSTAQAGTNTIQLVDVTDTELDTGRYYIALVTNNSSSTFFTTQITGLKGGVLGQFQQDTAFTLPSSFTFASAVSGEDVNILLCGAVLRSDFS